MRTEARVAPGVQLSQRHRVARAAAGGISAASVLPAALHLREEQRRQIARMHRVARLLALTIEANVLQRAAPSMRIHPECEDALVGSSELPCPGQYTATIDPH